MTSKLTTPGVNGAIANYQRAEEEEGSLGLRPEEVQPPYLRWNGRDGQILYTLDGTIGESFRVSVLRKLQSTRLRFNPDRDAPKDETILCRSDDMLLPRDAAQAAAIGAGPTCAECPLSQFGRDRQGSATKPGCSEVINLAVATDEDPPVPAFFSVKGTSIKAVWAALSQLEILARTTKRPAYTRVVELLGGTPVKEATKAYVPLVAKVLNERVPEERVEALAALWRLMRDRIDLADPETSIDSDVEAPEPVGPNAHVMRAEEAMVEMDRQDAERRSVEDRAAAMAAEAAVPVGVGVPVKAQPEDCHSLPSSAAPAVSPPHATAADLYPAEPEAPPAQASLLAGGRGDPDNQRRRH